MNDNNDIFSDGTFITPSNFTLKPNTKETNKLIKTHIKSPLIKDTSNYAKILTLIDDKKIKDKVLLQLLEMLKVNMDFVLDYINNKDDKK
jgi:hypothetical protein